MTCIEVLRKLTEYLQGEMSYRESQAVRHHADHCATCGVVLRSAQRTLHDYFSGKEEAAATDSHIGAHAA
jgi:hypothetical protein